MHKIPNAEGREGERIKIRIKQTKVTCKDD